LCLAELCGAAAVSIRDLSPYLTARTPPATVHGWTSVVGHRVSPQKLRNPPSHGLGTLDLQEMAHAVDRALVDVRE
jgi:hypothetical protein